MEASWAQDYYAMSSQKHLRADALAWVFGCRVIRAARVGNDPVNFLWDQGTEI